MEGERVLRPAAARALSSARAAARRFFSAYLVLYLLPVPLSELSSRVEGAWNAIAVGIVAAVDRAFFHLREPVSTALYGDTRYAYLRLVCLAAIGSVATVGWSLAVARRRVDDGALYEVARTYVRYALAAVMLLYGAMKLTGGQFPEPVPSRILATLGETRPEVLMWDFMGRSQAYQALAGAGEVAGALLLFSRRTATLGALVLAAVLTNVVVMDASYDVELKIHSANLLLAALFIASPDATRLLNVLVLNRIAEPAPPREPSARPWTARARLVAKCVAIAAILVDTAVEARAQAVTYGRSAPRPALYGLYAVEGGGDSLAPTDWTAVAIDPTWLAARQADGRRRSFVFAEDDSATTVTLTRRDEAAVLAFDRPDADHVTLSGTLEGKVVDVRLRRLRDDEVPLLRRGVRWVIE
jgi:hypothetical protein